MIDFHAHVFPSLQELVLHQKTDFLGEKYLYSKVFDFDSHWTSRFINQQSMSLISQFLPRDIYDAVEYGMSGIIAPRFVLTGQKHALFRSMQDLNIEKTVVIASPPFASNSFILDLAKRHPSFLIPVVVPPSLSEGASPEEWQHAFEDLAHQGAQGFKIHFNMDERDCDDICYQMMLKVASKLNLFVIIHTGDFSVSVYRRSGAAKPQFFEWVLENFPSVPVIFAHMNRHEPQEVWNLMRRYEQVYTDVSWQTPAMVKRALRQVGEDRLLLGSDWPLLHTALQRDALLVVREATTPKQFKKMTETNAQKLLSNCS